LVWTGQKISKKFFQTGQYDSCRLNSEMNPKWHCCLGKMGAEKREMAVTSGL
jgi:hypothetical protein